MYLSLGLAGHLYGLRHLGFVTLEMRNGMRMGILTKRCGLARQSDSGERRTRRTSSRPATCAANGADVALACENSPESLCTVHVGGTYYERRG